MEFEEEQTLKADTSQTSTNSGDLLTHKQDDKQTRAPAADNKSPQTEDTQLAISIPGSEAPKQTIEEETLAVVSLPHLPFISITFAL